MKNIGLKIFSVMIAIMLSYYVNSEGNESVIGITVPIELKGLPTQKTILWPLIRQTQVSIKGPSFLLSQIYTSPPSFKIKLPPNVGNRFVASFQKSDLVLPPSIKVIGIEPAEMEFTFDDLVKKEVPVHVNTVGSLKDGLKLGEIIATPRTVSITGPKTESDSIKAVETDPVDLRDIFQTTEVDLPIRPISRLADISSSEVKVKINVSSLQAERKFENVLVEVRSFGSESFVVSPENVAIEVSGPSDKIGKMKASDIIPYVRISESFASESEVPVMVDLPKSIELVAVEPDTLKVTKSSSGSAKKIAKVVKDKK